MVLGTIELDFLRFSIVLKLVRNYRDNNILQLNLFITVSCSIFVFRKKVGRKWDGLFGVPVSHRKTALYAIPRPFFEWDGVSDERSVLAIFDWDGKTLLEHPN